MRPVDLTRLPSVTQALAALAPAYDSTGEFPGPSIEVVREAGLLTATVGSSYGGPGLGVAGLTRILLALGRGDPSVALIASMTQLVHLAEALHPAWPAELYREVLASGGLINTLRVEPDLGSPSRGGRPATVARRTAGGWSLTGHKRFSTGAAGLDWLLIYAATDEPTPRAGNFVVPASSPGISIVQTWNQLGLRASGSHDVILTDVPVPSANFLPAPASPPADALQLPPAAIYLGVGRAALAYFREFALSRVPANLGRPVATTERFRAAAGEISVLLDTGERLLLDAATRFDAGRPVPDAAAARLIANRHAVAAVTLATRLLGNPGLSRDNPMERHFRDVQSAQVHAPQEDLALQTIGKAALMPG
jgi:alkylation response protein AidB-like acyl-CoA dehydrogenase